MHFDPTKLYFDLSTLTYYLYFALSHQEQAALIKEAVEAMSDEAPPIFDPLGEGVDPSELAAALTAEAIAEGGTSRRGTVSQQ